MCGPQRAVRPERPLWRRKQQRSSLAVHHQSSLSRTPDTAKEFVCGHRVGFDAVAQSVGPVAGWRRWCRRGRDRVRRSRRCAMRRGGSSRMCRVWWSGDLSPGPRGCGADHVVRFVVGASLAGAGSDRPRRGPRWPPPAFGIAVFASFFCRSAVPQRPRLQKPHLLPNPIPTAGILTYLINAPKANKAVHHPRS